MKLAYTVLLVTLFHVDLGSCLGYATRHWFTRFPTIVEGEPFNFTCNYSTDSTKPTEPFAIHYEVESPKYVTVSNTNHYTTLPKDRDGIWLTCNFDQYGNGTSFRGISTNATPYYIDDDVEKERNALINSGDILKCDVTGRDILYSWSCRGCTSKTDTLVIPSEPARSKGDKETISCTALVLHIPPVTIRWNVTWESDSSEFTDSSGFTAKVELINLAIIGCILLILCY